jgi:oxygen-independent coproporphyrinogen-3 oxidase
MSGIYIHIPFCDTKCIYCDFYSITNHTHKDEFISSLIKEINSSAKHFHNNKFDTIYFGGGTPSLLSYVDFIRIFDTLNTSLNIAGNSEVTIEANPGTLNKQKLAEFKKLPINRLSFGVQSFNDDDLKFLTRIHNSQTAECAVKHAQDAGYENISIDLIFALPNQTIEGWQSNLNKTIDLNIKHISAYSLIFEDGTPLMSMKVIGCVQQADELLECEMYLHTIEFLQANGLSQYEVSNFAKPGYECRHNLKYWNHEEYVGYGPSAASFIKNQRWVNVRNLNTYLKRVNSGETVYDKIEYIGRDKSIYEYIYLGLRGNGIDLGRFNEKYKTDFKQTYKKPFDLLISNQLATFNNNILKLTPKGYALCDEIIASYF